MATFKRYATVAYDTSNLSILSVESISEPKLVTLNPSDLMETYNAVLTPSGGNSSEQADLTNTLLLETGWVLRLYQSEFGSSHQLPLTLLRGLLLIPLQFGSLAWMWVNSTEYYTNTTQFALPSDLETTAVTANISYRAIAAPWTVAIFIGAVGVLLVWVNSVLLCLLCGKGAAPNTSSFPEIDMTAKSAGPILVITMDNSVAAPLDLGSFLRQAGLGNSESKFIIRAIGNKKVRAVILKDDEEMEHVVLSTSTYGDVSEPERGKAYV
jgi:hypothetical protein